MYVVDEAKMNKMIDEMTLIYEKFFGEAERLGVIWTLQGWAIKQGLFTKEEIKEDDHEYCDWSDNFRHADAITKILNYEIAYFVFRRLNGPWGEVVDFFRHEKCRFVNEYREQTGYELVGNTIYLD